MDDVDNHHSFKVANYHPFMTSIGHLSLYYFCVNHGKLRLVCLCFPVIKSQENKSHKDVTGNKSQEKRFTG